MQVRAGRRRDLGKGADVRHHVVPGLALDLGGAGQLGRGRLEVGLELGERLGRDGDAEVALGAHQFEP